MCVDPVTLAAVASSAKAVLPAVGGIVQNKVAGAQATAIEQDGDAAQTAAVIETQGLQRRNERVLADQRVQFLSSGVSGDSGSALEVAATDAAELELEALRTRYGGQLRKNAAYNRAKGVRTQGKIAMFSGFGSAGAELLAGGAQFGANKAAMKVP